MTTKVPRHLSPIPEPPAARWLFSDLRLAPIWLVIRLYAGYEWASAGWEKLHSPAWVGPGAGSALRGFLGGAIRAGAGAHPNVQGWYLWLIHHLFLPAAPGMSYLVSAGEFAVGIALILGLFTGIAAFFGGFMNANYLLAGTVSTNPALFILATLLVLAWRVSGYWGIDAWLLPALGVPGYPGKWFRGAQQGRV